MLVKRFTQLPVPTAQVGRFPAMPAPRTFYPAPRAFAGQMQDATALLALQAAQGGQPLSPDQLAVLGVNPGVLGQCGPGPSACAPCYGTSQFFKRSPGAMRRPLGVPETTIAAGATEPIVIEVDTVFKAKCLIVPSSIAANFAIVQIKVGNRDQFLNGSAPIPALAFSEQAKQCIEMDLDACKDNSRIVVSVKNITGVAANFIATFLGDSYDCYA